MAEDGVYMDIDGVTKMAEQFNHFGDVLDAVNKALEAAIMILKVTAFVGLVGGLAIEHYLEQIQPNVKKLSDKCKEMHLDLIGAIVSYRDGDDTGSQRFAH
jgi:hypothetical protein